MIMEVAYFRWSILPHMRKRQVPEILVTACCGDVREAILASTSQSKSLGWLVYFIYLSIYVTINITP